MGLRFDQQYSKTWDETEASATIPQSRFRNLLRESRKAIQPMGCLESPLTIVMGVATLPDTVSLFGCPPSWQSARIVVPHSCRLVK